MVRRELLNLLAASTASCFLCSQTYAQWPRTDRPRDPDADDLDPDEPEISRAPRTPTRRSQSSSGLGVGPCGADDTASFQMPRTSATTGNPQFDQVVAAELRLLRQAYKVNADFAFMFDEGAPNAYAFRPGAIGPNANVLMGLSLMQLAMRDYPGGWGAVIAGVLGHEWGHVFMYASGMRVPKYVMETHADFMAGWYMGCKNVYFRMPIAMDALASKMFNMGDGDGFFDPEKYGSPRQRQFAVLEGFKAAHMMAQSNANADPRYAFEQGIRFVERLVPYE